MICLTQFFPPCSTRAHRGWRRPSSSSSRIYFSHLAIPGCSIFCQLCASVRGANGLLISRYPRKKGRGPKSHFVLGREASAKDGEGPLRIGTCFYLKYIGCNQPVARTGHPGMLTPGGCLLRFEEPARLGRCALYGSHFRNFPFREGEHFLKICRYVERSPLRAGLVKRAQNWPCGKFVSSATLDARTSRSGGVAVGLTRINYPQVGDDEAE